MVIDIFTHIFKVFLQAVEHTVVLNYMGKMVVV